MGYLFLLDIHFGKKCNFRIDDIDETIKYKMDYVLRYALEHNIKNIFIAGDIYENSSINRKSFMNSIKIFNRFKENGINVYSIFGNHDEYRYNLEYRDYTPLSDLISLNLVKHLNEFIDEKENVYIKGFDYISKDLISYIGSKKNNKNKKYTEIVVAHSFYNNELMGGKEHNITDEILEHNSIDYIVLGHDHTKYKDVKVNNTTILRCGSLVRDNTTKNSLERIPSFYHFCNNNFEEIQIPNCNVLKDIVKAKVEVKKEVISYKEMIEEINTSATDDTDDVLDLIDNIENEDVKRIIRRFI